jgi:hypothetical protein
MIPCFAELVEECLDLVDSNGDVARIVESLSLGNAFKDVREVVHQLRECDGHFGFLRRWAGLLSVTSVTLRAAFQ